MTVYLLRVIKGVEVVAPYAGACVTKLASRFHGRKLHLVRVFCTVGVASFERQKNDGLGGVTVEVVN